MRVNPGFDPHSKTRLSYITSWEDYVRFPQQRRPSPNILSDSSRQTDAPITVAVRTIKQKGVSTTSVEHTFPSLLVKNPPNWFGWASGCSCFTCYLCPLCTYQTDAQIILKLKLVARLISSYSIASRFRWVLLLLRGEADIGRHGTHRTGATQHCGFLPAIPEPNSTESYPDTPTV